METAADNQPLKRDPVLQPLSKAHHDMLMGCLLLEKGMKQQVTHQRLADYAGWFLKETVLPHALLEWTWLKPISEQERVKAELNRMDVEQGEFRHLMVEMADLTRLVNLLRQHVRHQERIFFAQLQAIPNLLASVRQPLPPYHGSCTAGWRDAFWLPPV